MKIYTNERLIQRNKKIGQYLTIASLVVLGGGLYLSFRPDPSMVTLSLVALLVGFLLSQIGIYFGNRWGRSPRPDQTITASLKGPDDKYTLYNFTSPTPHLLLGPNGIWVFLPYHQGGKIVYEKGRWKQKGGNLYLRIFAQDGIGRPDLEIDSQVDSVRRELLKKLPEDQIPPVQPALVFTNEKADIAADDAPVPTLPAKKLKDVIRKKPKDNALTPERLAAIQQALLKGTFEAEE